MKDTIEHMLNVNGTRIRAFEQGHGPLVLLVHGFPELAYSWRHQMPALAAAGYRVVAIEQRGYGRSSKFWEPDAYRIDHLVADLIGVIDALGESEAVIVGHDWGAPVVWSAAWMHPEKIRGVVGMSVPFAGKGLIGLPGNPFGEIESATFLPELAGPGQDFYHTYWSTLDGIINEIEADLHGWIRDLIYLASGEGVAASGVETEGLDIVALTRASGLCIAHGSEQRERFSTPDALPVWLSAADLDVYVEAFESSGFHGPLSYYRNLPADREILSALDGQKLSVPAYFIGGEYDVATLWNREGLERADEVIEDFRGQVVLPGCGHWIQQERTTETNKLLLDFFGGLD